MKLPVAALVALCLAIGLGTGPPASAQASLNLQVPACSSVDIGSDQMGVRAKDAEGNWRYITISDLSFTRYIQTPNGPLLLPSLKSSEMQRKFGACAAVVAQMAAPFMGVPSEGPGSEPLPGQVVTMWLNFRPVPTKQVALYTTGGTDLLRIHPHFYATQIGLGCGLAKLDQCTVDQRAKMTGVVRQIADSFAQLGVPKVDRGDIRFEGGKLRATFRVKTASGRQELEFAEE
jgi:hypothetical protein